MIKPIACILIFVLFTSHLAPIQALLHNPLTNVLLSCDRKGTLCFWDSFRDEFSSFGLINFRLDISSAPSQVIYSGMDLLTAAWVPSMEAVAVGDSRGVISLYAAKPTHISTLYSPQGFQTIVNETPEESNGLFDTAEKEPYFCISFSIVDYVSWPNIPMLSGRSSTTAKPHPTTSASSLRPLPQVAFSVMI